MLLNHNGLFDGWTPKTSVQMGGESLEVEHHSSVSRHQSLEMQLGDDI